MWHKVSSIATSKALSPTGFEKFALVPENMVKYQIVAQYRELGVHDTYCYPEIHSLHVDQLVADYKAAKGI